jgi:epoxyqueuosine reductase
MLVHICCSVDSHFFLEKLQQDFPDEPLTGFFYDPNIHPYSEYRLRYLDVRRSCRKLGIDLIEGAYDFESWMNAVRGLEKEPEKGARCAVCFDRRFEVSAQKALELGEKRFTTTLLVSPQKSQEQLRSSGARYEAEHGLQFIFVDYRSGGGSQDQSRVTKEQKLYRQDYCGCLFGLEMQRDAQQKLMDEMFSPIDGRVLPASIEARLELYEARMALEDAGGSYRIVKEKFLNYRQRACTLLKGKQQVLPAYALVYSTLPRRRAQGRIAEQVGALYCMNRDDIKFVTLEHFNATAGTDYPSVKALIFDPLPFDEEVAVRQRLIPTLYGLTPLIVVDTIPEGKVTLLLDALTYEDTLERLLPEEAPESGAINLS